MFPTSPDQARSAYRDRTRSARSPRCAIASITDPKVHCADNTFSANPAGSSATVVITRPSPFTPHQRVEIDPGRRGLRGLPVLHRDHRGTQRGQHAGFHRMRELARLHHGIAQRDHPRLFAVAPERIAETDLTG